MASEASEATQAAVITLSRGVEATNGWMAMVLEEEEGAERERN